MVFLVLPYCFDCMLEISLKKMRSVPFELVEICLVQESQCPLVCLKEESSWVRLPRETAVEDGGARYLHRD